MAKKKGNSSVGYSSPYNEFSGKGEGADVNGNGIYFDGWDEINKMHLSTEMASLKGSANSRSGDDILGGPASGEPDAQKK